MSTRKYSLFILIMLSVLAAACSPRHSYHPTAGDNINATLQSAEVANRQIAQQQTELPAAVKAALIPKMQINLPQAQQESLEPRFDLAVNRVPAKLFFMGLTKDTELSMVVSPDVDGEITLDLKNVTIEDVLQTTQNMFGYEYRRTPNGYEILGNQLMTRIFNVNFLDISRIGSTSTELSSGQLTQRVAGRASSGGGSQSSIGSGQSSGGTGSGPTGSGTNIQTVSQSHFWRELQLSVAAMIGEADGRSVVVNSQAGVIVVRAKPMELRQVADYLERVEEMMGRQVVLEVKILEIELSDEYQAGIDWKFLGTEIGSGFQVPNPYLKSPIKWTQNFETTINALETQGTVQVLSSPRVSTLNNQKAVIKVGNDEFFVTNISAVPSNNDNDPTQDIELTPFFSGITLDVTPQVDAQGLVTLHVRPAVSTVKDDTKEVLVGGSVGNIKLPLAKSSVRETDTIVRAENGQVVIIAGLMQHDATEQISQLPFFGNIPYLGALFRTTSQSNRKSELVILIRPIVMNAHNWAEDVQLTNERYAELNRGFHFGARPDLFGTQAEQAIRYGPPSPRQQRRGR